MKVNQKRPPASEVFEIAHKGKTPEEALRLLAETFPEADPKYIRELFEKSAQARDLQIKRLELDKARSKAVSDFLASHSYVNIAEAVDHLGLSPQQVWNKIMAEADLPLGDMPKYIQRE